MGYTIIQYYTLLYTIIHYYTVLYSIIQYYTVVYSIIQYYTVLYSIIQYYTVLYSTRSSGRSAPLLLAPAEGWGALRAPRALWALLGAFGPLLNSSIQKYTLRRSFRHLELH